MAPSSLRRALAAIALLILARPASAADGLQAAPSQAQSPWIGFFASPAAVALSPELGLDLTRPEVFGPLAHALDRTSLGPDSVAADPAMIQASLIRGAAARFAGTAALRARLAADNGHPPSADLSADLRASQELAPILSAHTQADVTQSIARLRETFGASVDAEIALAGRLWEKSAELAPAQQPVLGSAAEGRPSGLAKFDGRLPGNAFFEPKLDRFTFKLGIDEPDRHESNLLGKTFDGLHKKLGAFWKAMDDSRPSKAVETFVLPKPEGPPVSWDGYYASFQSVLRQHLAAHRDLYAQDRENGGGLTAFLEDDLGFRLGTTAEDTRVPTPLEIARRYNERVDALVASRVLTEDETVRPARVFVDKEGQVLFLPIGAPVPPGAQVQQGLMRGLDWVLMIANGYLPVGETNLVNGTDFAAAEHDLAHLKGMLRHPRYMAEARKAARSIARDPASDFRGSRQLRPDLGSRVFFALEYLATIKPERYEAIKKILLWPSATIAAGKMPAGRVEYFLREQSDEDLEALRQRLRREYPLAVDRVGGAAADLRTIRDTSRLGGGQVVGQSLDSIFEQAMKAQGRQELCKWLARLEVAIVDFGAITPERFLRQALAEKVDPESAVYEVMVGSGVLDPDSSFRDGFAYDHRVLHRKFLVLD